MLFLLTPLVLVAFLVTGCASYIPLENGKYLVTKSTQDPVMWGVSNSDSAPFICNGKQKEGYNYENLEFSDCHQYGELKHTSAPGYGTTIVNGMLNALTFGLVAAFWGSGGDSSASASSNSNASANATGVIVNRGGHK